MFLKFSIRNELFLFLGVVIVGYMGKFRVGFLFEILFFLSFRDNVHNFWYFQRTILGIIKRGYDLLELD